MISATAAACARRARTAGSGSGAVAGSERSVSAWPGRFRLSDALNVAKRTDSGGPLDPTGGGDTKTAPSRRSRARLTAAPRRTSRATDRDMDEGLRVWWILVDAAGPAPTHARPADFPRLSFDDRCRPSPWSAAPDPTCRP